MGDDKYNPVQLFFRTNFFDDDASFDDWLAAYRDRDDEFLEQVSEQSAQRHRQMEELSARRRSIIDPLLAANGLSVYRWEKKADVSSKVGQRYLNGLTTPRAEEERKLARVLGLDQLPYSAPADLSQGPITDREDPDGSIRAYIRETWAQGDDYDANLERWVNWCTERIRERLESGWLEELERAERRRAVLDPTLQERGLTVYRWEKNAGVGAGVGQRYLNGLTAPRRDQARKLARALGIERLPD